MIHRQTGLPIWFRVENPDQHVLSLLSRGFKEVYPNKEKEIKLTGFSHFARETMARYFYKIHAEIILEFQSVSFVEPWFIVGLSKTITKRGISRIKDWTQQLLELEKTYRKTLYSAGRKKDGVGIEVFRLKQLELPCRKNNQLDKIENNIQLLTESFDPWLKELRSGTVGNRFYSLNFGRTRTENRIYFNFLTAVRIVNGLGPWNMAGLNNPNSGRKPISVEDRRKINRLVPILIASGKTVLSNPLSLEKERKEVLRKIGSTSDVFIYEEIIQAGKEGEKKFSWKDWALRMARQLVTGDVVISSAVKKLLVKPKKA